MIIIAVLLKKLYPIFEMMKKYAYPIECDGNTTAALGVNQRKCTNANSGAFYYKKNKKKEIK